jgi:hypothetical protein
MKTGRTRGVRAPAAVAWLAALAASATVAAAQLPDQSFEVVGDTSHATVGDPVTLRFRVRLSEGDLLYDSVPRPAGELPEAVRILSVEKLRRRPDRIYTGRAVVAFYRPGRRPVPVFTLPFMRSVKGLTRGALTSDSAFVEIDSVAPPGNPSLKDIKPIERQRGPDPRLVAAIAAAALVVLAAWLVRRRGPPAPTASPAPASPPAETLGPYEAAVARLARLDAEPWPEPRDADRYYEAVADTLRRYLREAHGIPAPTHTTAELIGALPPALAGDGLAQRCAAVLGEADVVKFARAPREADAGKAWARDARALLDAWHAAPR